MNQQFPEKFKIQAVKQVTAQGHTITSVSDRLGASTTWMKRYGDNNEPESRVRTLFLARSPE